MSPTPTLSHHAVTQPTDHHASVCLEALFTFSSEVVDLSNSANMHTDQLDPQLPPMTVDQFTLADTEKFNNSTCLLAFVPRFAFSTEMINP